MTTAQQLIDGGFSRSVANDRDTLATDAEVLEYLNTRFQAYFAQLAAAAPDAYRSRTTLTLSGSPASLTLPLDIISLERAETAAGVKVNIIPVHERDRPWHLAPAVYRVGRSLISAARTGDPIAGSQLTLYLLDAPAALSTLATVLDTRWPTRHNSLLSADVAIYLSMKDEGRDPKELLELKKERQRDLETFYSLNGIQTKKETPHRGAREKADE